MNWNRWPTIIGLLGAAASLAGLVREGAGFWSKHEAWKAQKLADDPASTTASLELADRSLALDANNFQSLHVKAVKLRDLGRFDELEAFLPRLLAVHPNQANAFRLAGEEKFRRGDASAAADLLWEAMWINPTPPTSPAAYWRMTMAASDRAGRPEDAMRAAIRALSLMERDNYLKPADRRDLLLDVGEFFTRQGRPITGAHLIAVARSIQVR